LNVVRFVKGKVGSHYEQNLFLGDNKRTSWRFYGEKTRGKRKTQRKGPTENGEKSGCPEDSRRKRVKIAQPTKCFQPKGGTETHLEVAEELTAKTVGKGGEILFVDVSAHRQKKRERGEFG